MYCKSVWSSHSSLTKIRPKGCETHSTKHTADYYWIYEVSGGYHGCCADLVGAYKTKNQLSFLFLLALP
jgi:hypothetical protein